MATPQPHLTRRGLCRSEAAAHIGVGETLFMRMVMDGRMPKPVHIDGRRVWDLHKIELAFDRLSGNLAQVNEWDGVL